MLRTSVKEERSESIAIVGMACLFPGAPDLQTFWSNIVHGVDCIREVTEQEWSTQAYYDPEQEGFGLSYSKRGGFISEHAQFDPLKFGIMPASVAGMDPDQLLTLKIAIQALADAGYHNREFNRDRAEIILGRISAPGAGSMNLIHQSTTVREIERLLSNALPDADPDRIAEMSRQVQEKLAPCNSDNIPGVMPNVLAGRIAAKLGFRGKSLLVDAACASSMVAIEAAVNDLQSNRCDLALAGGLHVNSSNTLFQMFCGLGALSRRDQIRPFDDQADGTLLGEGIGIICLKRLSDAITDGDRIYAAIRSVASSSDGYGGSVLAPSLDGEALAMQRAYDEAGISPATVELLEAHGTATPAGDLVELQAIQKVFDPDGARRSPWCALGSVKSMIGHCQSASAVAGVIKAALSLYHKILPPTLNVSQPSKRIEWSTHPCYVLSQARPWIASPERGYHRRAAVSAFGFGGINAHAVLEEHPCGDHLVNLIQRSSTERAAIKASTHETRDANKNSADGRVQQWTSEVLAFSAVNTEELIRTLQVIDTFIIESPRAALKDIAYTVNSTHSSKQATGGANSPYDQVRLAIIASDVSDLQDKIRYFISSAKAQRRIWDAEKGIYFCRPSDRIDGKLAFMYPGLGSAYVGMLGDLCFYFPEVREVFEIVDTLATVHGATVLPSSLIFPQPGQAGKAPGSDSLAAADFAVVAVLLAEYALHYILSKLNILPDSLMGCSTGEFAAITTGGGIDVLSAAETFYKLSTDVALAIKDSPEAADLASLRILTSYRSISSLLDSHSVYLNSDLADDHIIVTGSRINIEKLCLALRSQAVAWQLLPSAIPYHTPLVSGLVDENDVLIQGMTMAPLSVPSWSCSEGGRYPADGQLIKAISTRLFCKPVLIRETLQAMYDHGIRKFVEVGPNGLLTTLASTLFSGRAHLSIASNLSSRPALLQIHHLLGVLFVHGAEPAFGYLYKGREPIALDWNEKTKVGQSAEPKLKLTYPRLEIEKLELSDRQRPAMAGVSRSSPAVAGEDLVLQSMFNTNAAFYASLTATQEKIMKMYLAGQPPVQALTRDTEVDYQYISRFRVNESGNAFDLHIDLGTDLYLLDHAIGGFISQKSKLKVHLMPLMVSLEIMAQAATSYQQSRFGRPLVIVRLDEVKAFKRILVDEQGVDLEITIEPLHASAHADDKPPSDDCLRVSLFDKHLRDTVIMTADFVFSHAYPASPSASIKAGERSPLKFRKKEDLYGPEAMFHGPRMQSLLSIDSTGKRTTTGTVSCRPATGWFTDDSVAGCILHPLLLDNASQLVLFHLYENDFPAIALLPFHIACIEFFQPCPSLSETAQVAALLASITEKSTMARVEIATADGALWSRITDISSRRISLTKPWLMSIANPEFLSVGEEVPLRNSLNSRGILVQIDKDKLPADDSTVDWCLDYFLTRSERRFYSTELRNDKRRLEWLLGRIAAKQAVQSLLRSRADEKLGPIDIEIRHDQFRMPRIFIDSLEREDINVSVSHSNGLATGFAAFANEGSPGVDVEEIEERDTEFGARFLADAERAYLDSFSNKKTVELTRFWSAKEAVFKALGGRAELTSLRIDTEKSQESSLIVASAGREFVVETDVIGSRVLAYTLAGK